jgi:hypothetical protein
MLAAWPVTVFSYWAPFIVLREEALVPDWVG